jgi:hypothetical protein
MQHIYVPDLEWSRPVEMQPQIPIQSLGFCSFNTHWNMQSSCWGVLQELTWACCSPMPSMSKPMITIPTPLFSIVLVCVASLAKLAEKAYVEFQMVFAPLWIALYIGDQFVACLYLPIYVRDNYKWELRTIHVCFTHQKIKAYLLTVPQISVPTFRADSRIYQPRYDSSLLVKQ